MRILHALSQTELTGSEAYAFDLVSHQHRAGHETLTISDRFHLSFPGEKLNLELSTDSFWTRMANIRRLRRLLIEKRIDVIHAHSRGACRHVYWAALGLKIPVLTTVHGYQHASLSKRLFNIYGDYVLAVCEKIRDQMIFDLRTKPYAIEVLRNPAQTATAGISLPSFPSRNGDAPVPLPAAEPGRILLAGRNSGPKGRRLRQVFRHLAREKARLPAGARVHLVLSGLSAPEREGLQAEFPEAVVEGHLPSLQEAIALGQIVVASGRIALEALAQGRRVFALGEAAQPGFLGPATESAIMASNFGDVGPEEKLDAEAVLTELLRELAAPTPELQCRRAEALLAEFSAERIQERILELYRGLRLFKRARHLPILMYHKVVATPPETPHRTFVTVETFRRHLRFFRRRGFTTLHFRELADFWWERRPLAEFPRRPLVLTFDDGYRNNLERAAPLLVEHDLKAEIFLLADPGLQRNTWDPDEGDESSALMSPEEKRRLPRPHYAIGSHGLSHRAFPGLADAEVLEELRVSKARLEADFGEKVCAVAYPFGAIDARLPRLAREAGYDFAVNTDQGPVYWFTEPRSLFRVNVFPEDGAFSLWRKTAAWYREYYFRKRGR